MKKIGLIGIAASALSVAVIGFAGPAQAQPGWTFGGNGNGNGSGFGWPQYGPGDDSNNPWLNQLYPRVKVPKVDTSVRN